MPALGLGTWRMGEDSSRRQDEVATLQLALELGLRLIDTAEMYGEGKAEELIGEALAKRRDEIFLVSKVYPHNASQKGMPLACERSLRRLRTERLDLYLLHWPGKIPLNETVEAFQKLQEAGKIRYYGVSNFDVGELKELWKIPGGDRVGTNQVLYNLTRRGIEWELAPWMRKQRIPIMAYSPIEQARLLSNPQFVTLAKKWSMTAAQLALAWLLNHQDVIAIPKTSNPERLKENAGALKKTLSREQLNELDCVFRPPDGPRPLEML